MCEGFLRHFGKLLPLEESFTDWLVVKLRPLRKQKLSFTTFHSHYLEEKKISEGGEGKKFFMLLQFLNYPQNLDYERGALGSTTYRQVTFQVKNFLEYQKKSNNYYQLKKLIEFFYELQTNSLIKFFSDSEYPSLITIPEVALTKGKQNCWVGRVWISEELFRYSHPFILPNLITKKLTKDEVEVQFKVIQVFSSVNIAKTFWIKDFFENYSVKLTNQQKTKMKNYFIVKDKTKRLVIVIYLATLVYFSGLEPVKGIGLLMPTAPLVRVQPSFEHSYKKPKIAKLVPRKVDRISCKIFL